MRLSSVVIWYNPKETDVLNIKSYINYINKLYIIDNSKKNNKKLLENLKNMSKIEYIYSDGNNLGIAKALNLACEKAIIDKFEWILTMDQDSYFDFQNMKKYLEIFSQIKNSNIGIISPNHILKNDIVKIDENKEFIDTDCVMTSGNLLNLSVWKKVNKFDENLFIDEVDNEMCYRILEKGYQIKQLSKIKMFHELGNLEKRNFFTRKISVLNHNYIRKYYIIRNKFYIFKKYRKYRLRYVYSILNDFFKVIFYEKDKLRKLRYMFRGINDFFKNKMGELDDKK
jgi:glycosyltransferase, group 2 family